MNQSSFKKVLGLLAFFTAALLISNPAFAQDGGGDIGGDNGGGVVGGGGGAAGGLTGGTENASDIEPVRSNLGGEPEPIDNLRFQGFVGATSDSITNNFVFVGPSSTVSSDSSGSFGGGNTQGGGGGGARGGGGGQGGFTPVNVTRRSIRAIVRPSFSSPKILPQVISNRFVSRLDRQPTTTGLGRKVNVKIENRTATVTGSVASDLERERIIRQLRLEPGVYKIVDQLNVTAVSSK